MQQTRAVEEYYGLETTGDGRQLGGRMRSMGWACVIFGVPVTLLGIFSGLVMGIGLIMIVGGAIMVKRAPKRY